jgi:hypothetical protein
VAGACASVTVTVNTLTPGTISGNQTVCSGGDPIAFTVTTPATGVGTLSYKWQSNITGCGGVFSDITGANSATFDPPSGFTVTTYYRCIVTSTFNSVACPAITNCITVTVNTTTPGTVADNQIICAGGDPAAFTQTGAASGSGVLTYQWQNNITGCGGTFADIGGATNVTFDPPVLTQTTYYRRVAISTFNGVSCPASSTCLIITVNPLPTTSAIYHQ